MKRHHFPSRFGSARFPGWWRRPATASRRRFCPEVELLERRLPPGDVLLGPLGLSQVVADADPAPYAVVAAEPPAAEAWSTFVPAAQAETQTLAPEANPPATEPQGEAGTGPSAGAERLVLESADQLFASLDEEEEADEPLLGDPLTEEPLGEPEKAEGVFDRPSDATAGPSAGGVVAVVGPSLGAPGATTPMEPAQAPLDLGRVDEVFWQSLALLSQAMPPAGASAGPAGAAGPAPTAGGVLPPSPGPAANLPSPIVVTPSPAPASPTPSPVGNTLVFQLTAASGLEQVHAWAAAAGASVQPTTIPGVYQIDGPASELGRLADLLRQQPYVGYVETPQPIGVSLVPNDPLFTSNQQQGLSGPHGISAPRAWDTITDALGVTVAVLDTGIDYNHPDLYLNIWVNQLEIPPARLVNLTDIDGDGLFTFWDLNNPINIGPTKIADVNGDSRITATDLLSPFASGGWADGVDGLDLNGFIDDLVGWNFVANNNDPFDDHGHGTNVVGRLGQIGNNGVGGAGVAWKVQMMPLKMLDSNAIGTDIWAANAIYYSVAKGAKVSNNAWGGAGGGATLQNAIIHARDVGDQVFVAPAGNNGVNTDVTPNYPASFPFANILAVAASNSATGQMASFASFGPTTVDLFAPGVGVTTTAPGTGYVSRSGSSMSVAHAAGVAALLRQQNPGWTYGQVINRILETVDPVLAFQGKCVSGGLLNAGAAVGTGPEIRVQQATTELISSASSYTFGVTSVGAPIVKTFTVKNVGGATLTLNPTITVPAGFSVVSGFGSLSLAPGASTTFQVQLNATSAGTFSGTLSLLSNDADENPFNFTITGYVGAWIIDDNDPGFSKTAGWTYFTGQGYQNDITYAGAGSGSAVASWTFNGLNPGLYRVSATWFAFSNRATNSPFTVYDGSVAIGSVAINQQVIPNDFSHAGAVWEDLGGPYYITGPTLTVTLNNLANGFVMADAIRVERIGNLPPVQEIEVLQSGTVFNDGSTLAFGSTAVGVPLSRTFTVRNVGSTNLTLGAMGSIPSGYAVTGYAPTVLVPGASTSFTITLTAAAAGPYSGLISFANTDSDENPFDILVTGSVSSAAIIDDGDAGFSTSGTWPVYTGQGYLNDVRAAAAGTGSSIATWTFSGVTPGYYRVSATWSPASNRATNAPFTVSNNGVTIGTVAVNQQLTPNDFTDVGKGWKDLGGPYYVTGGMLVVQLNNAANNHVIADGIRIEMLAPLPATQEIEVIFNGNNLNSGGPAAFGSTSVGVPVTRTFTIRNVGSANLSLGALGLVPSGFSVAGYAPTVLAPGATTSFSVTLTAAAPGTYTGALTISNNDGDENPFVINLSGTVTNFKQIIDDGDTPFTIVGAWIPTTGQGYQNDVRYIAAGTGTATATWTFIGLASGTYRVSATWSPFSNRATNAPFTVNTGVSTLVTVNQQLTPSSFTEAGTAWQDLAGPYVVTGGSIIVTLSNAANNFVIADAIRIEKII